MKIPLEKRLKKRMHVEIAFLQDEVIEILYAIESKLVLHGGTAVWRCYGGSRFSEDLDFYFHASKSELEKFAKDFLAKTKERGLQVMKFNQTENLVFSKISNGQAEIRIEINFSAERKKPVVATFEKTDGSLMQVFTLSAEELLLEKIVSYENRLFARDLYDIFHLSNYVKHDSVVKQQVEKLLKNPGQPVDEKNLKALVYSGAIPTFEQMIQALKRWF